MTKVKEEAPAAPLGPLPDPAKVVPVPNTPLEEDHDETVPAARA